MEIGQKAVNDLEFVARAKENVGLARMRRKGFTMGILGEVLKRTSRGGADGNNTISRLLRGVDRFGGSWRKCVTLCVKVDVFQPFRANRLKRS